MRSNRLITAVISFALALLPAAAHADTFFYSVSSHFSSFSVDGTITTDTNIGVLSNDNLVDFSLLLTAAGQSEILNLANVDNQGLYGDALSATDTGLFFDFTAPSAGLFFQNTSTGTYLCIQTYGCDSGADAHFSTNLGGTTLMEEQSGTVQLASFVPTSVTPEPSSLLLLLTGMVAAVGLAWHRQAIL